MWSITEAASFLAKAPKLFKKLFQSLLLFNKDSIGELVDMFMDTQPKNMSARIDNIVGAVACMFWTSNVFKILTALLSFNLSNIFSAIIGFVIQFILATVCILGLYNHKESWNHIFLKVVIALIAVILVISVFSLFGAIFSFSLVGLIKLLKCVCMIVCTLSLCIALLE